MWLLSHNLHGGVQDEDGEGDDAGKGECVQKCNKVSELILLIIIYIHY